MEVRKDRGSEPPGRNEAEQQELCVVLWIRMAHMGWGIWMLSPQGVAILDND